ncbi:DUF4249 family protein [Pedobacter steynii]|nr:DUF4249 family protein [Pedobacter steynii]NQX40726.1 DUF4249 family protein [Pedobacter steynii]
MSCEETITPKLPEESKIAVTAQLTSGQAPVLHIVEINNINKQESPKTIENAEVSIQDVQTKEIFSCLPLSDGYWKNERFQAQPGKTYQLNVKTKNREVNAVCTVPSSFTTSAERSDDQNESTITLQLPVPNLSPLVLTMEARTYRMEGTNIVYLSNWEKVNMKCKDAATDNIRYQELPAPYSKLFLPAKTTIKQLVFSPEYQNGLRKFRVHVKSVEPVYYKYLYDYEYLKNNNSNGANSYIGLQSNINNGLGIFGGVYENVIAL